LAQESKRHLLGEPRYLNLSPPIARQTSYSNHESLGQPLDQKNFSWHRPVLWLKNQEKNNRSLVSAVFDDAVPSYGRNIDNGAEKVELALSLDLYDGKKEVFDTFMGLDKERRRGYK
jgi:hypothetical protein